MGEWVNARMKTSKNPTYRSWSAMKRRCEDPLHNNFKYYGGRGITVCDRWMKFENFVEDMKERPEGKTISRKDNDGNYSKENCEWSDKVSQENNKSSNTWIEYRGQRRTLAEWSRIIGLKKNTLIARIITYKWPIEKAMKNPLYDRSIS